MREEVDTVSTDRLTQIKDLEDFINGKYKRLCNIVEKFGWSEDYLSNSPRKIKCPVNSGHWVAESSLEKHVKMCSLVENSYLKEDLERQPPRSHFFYTKSTSAVPVLIGKDQLTKLLSEAEEITDRQPGEIREIEHVPETMDRYITEFSPQERLAIYNYTVEKGKAANKPVNVTVEDLLFDFENKNQDDDRPKSQLELLAEQRDYKRRRQSYRAKNVHVTNKSYTEVMKEVIENHTQFLTEIQKQEEIHQEEPQKSDFHDNMASEDSFNRNEKIVSEKEFSKSRRHRSRDRSRDRYHRQHHKHKRSRSHSRSRSKHKKHKKH